MRLLTVSPRGFVGKGKGKGFELGTCLEHSRNRKTTGILEPERERSELQER